MTSPIPLRYAGEGEFRVPSPHWGKRSDAEYVIGEVYRMAPVEERSLKSHNHYFAAINEGWQNLPEHEAERFQSPEHLRKFALIKAGYADERSIVCASKAEAHRVAAFIKPMDDFAVVLVSEATIKVYTAQSQSMKAMGRKVFQESKDAVLGAIDDLIGAPSGSLAREAGRAA